MHIVNPREGKRPVLEVDVPFMLWCPKRSIYVITVITKWYYTTSRYVLRDTQGRHSPDIAVFCIADHCGTDLFESADAARKSLMDDTYTIYYVL